MNHRIFAMIRVYTNFDMQYCHLHSDTYKKAYRILILSSVQSFDFLFVSWIHPLILHSYLFTVCWDFNFNKLIIKLVVQKWNLLITDFLAVRAARRLFRKVRLLESSPSSNVDAGIQVSFEISMHDASIPFALIEPCS